MKVQIKQQRHRNGAQETSGPWAKAGPLHECVRTSSQKDVRAEGEYCCKIKNYRVYDGVWARSLPSLLSLLCGAPGFALLSWQLGTPYAHHIWFLAHTQSGTITPSLKAAELV